MFIALPDIRHAAYWLLRHGSTKYARHLPFSPPLSARPQVVEVELTNDCDIDCSFCYRTRMTREVGYMTLDHFRRIVDEMSGWGYCVMRMVGVGEPALHPEIDAILAYLQQKRIPVEITTNGKLFERIAPDRLLDLGVHTVGVSVDGHDARSYNRLRRGGDHDWLLAMMSDFHARRAARGLKHPWIVIRNVILPGTETERHDRIRSFKATWAGISDRIRFNTLEPLKGAVYDTGRVCDDIFYNLHVRWDGQVPLCAYQHLYAPQEWLGSVETASLAQLWQARRMREVRGNHLSGDLGSSEFCRKCFTQQCQKRVKGNQMTHNAHAGRVLSWVERQAWRLVG